MLREMEHIDTPRILCVDDEPDVLQGLVRQLRRRFSVLTATSGAAGLETLVHEGPFAVVVSDMRMPGMDGAAFLNAVSTRAPETVRILLTGYADLDAAIAAVNEANIFRFLSKPCPAEMLLQTLDAATDQYRLVTAERVLLEQTLHGSVQVLTDLLAIAQPTAFGRATRAKQRVTQVARRLGVRDTWQMEVAAMLSQIGCVALPPQTAERFYHGRALTREEEAMTARLPDVAEQLLAHIPRLDGVRAILAAQGRRFDENGQAHTSPHGADTPLGGRILKAVLDMDALEAQGMEGRLALDTLVGRTGWYDPQVLDALEAMLGTEGAMEVREVRLRDVRAGMIFAEDVTARGGLLLIARGQEVTAGLLERLRNFSEQLGVREPVRMILPPSAVSGGRIATG